MIVELLIHVLIFTAVLANTQLLNKNCPPDWVSNNNTCYKFAYGEKLSYEQAKKECLDNFASLISVDSIVEHQFLVQYLVTNDLFRNTWLTRGIQDCTDRAKWYWEGDATPIPSSGQYWLPQKQRITGVIIVYTYNDVQYGWSKVDKSSLLSYICEIPQSLAYKLTTEQRTFEYGISFQNFTNIEKGPIFQEQPTSLIVLGDTPTAQLECRAICNPGCQYKWYKGLMQSQEVTTNTDSRYTVRNGKFTIQSPTEKKDASDYQCQVSNKFGTVLSNPVKLAFGLIGEFSNIQDAPVYAKAYEGSAIQCSQIKTDPEVTYIWLRGRPPETIFPETTPYAFISVNGRLYFSEVTLVDALEYYCQVSLTSLTTTALGTSPTPSRISRPIRMIVQQQVPKTNWGPEIQDDFIYVSPERPLKGYNVRLECFAYGSAINYESTWRYQWSRLGNQIPASAKFSDFNRVMIIHNAKPEDEGNYVCTVSRGTIGSHQKNLYLRLYAVPYFLVPLMAQHVDLGSDLTWKCEASGYPFPTYSWYKDGIVLQTVPGEMVVAGNTLTITNLQQKHNGMYQCAATNYLGTSMSEAQLRVLAFKPSFSKTPLPQQIYGAVKGNITIQCRPEAAPAPLIEWYFGSTLLSTSEKYKIQLNGDLVITGLSEVDAGLYLCKATNDLGEAESSGNLIIKHTTTTNVGLQRNQSERHDVSCNSDSMSVFIPSTLLSQNETLSWRDPHCTVTNNGTHYVSVVSHTACGTTVKFTDSEVIFENDLIIRQSTSLPVSSHNDIVDFGGAYSEIIPVKCVYPRRQNVTTAYIPAQTRVRFFEKRYGHMDVELEQYHSDKFDTVIRDITYPREVPINQDMYIKLHTIHNSSDIAIKVDSCVATPSIMPADGQLYPLIDHGCPASPAVKLYPSAFNEVKFSVHAFEFKSSPGSVVYIHCQISVCLAKNPQCVVGCRSRQRREVSAADDSSHLVSGGPYLLVAEQGSVQMATIVAAVCACLAVVATIVAAVGWRRKLNAPKHDSKLISD